MSEPSLPAIDWVVNDPVSVLAQQLFAASPFRNYVAHDTPDASLAWNAAHHETRRSFYEIAARKFIGSPAGSA